MSGRARWRGEKFNRGPLFGFLFLVQELAAAQVQIVRRRVSCRDA